MNRYFATLGLVVAMLGCQGANDVTGPNRLESGLPGPEPTIAPPNPRMHPVVISQRRDPAVVAGRPQVTPRAFPCQVASGEVEWKNKPCEPCVVTNNFEYKNKPCYED